MLTLPSDLQTQQTGVSEISGFPYTYVMKVASIVDQTAAWRATAILLLINWRALFVQKEPRHQFLIRIFAMNALITVFHAWSQKTIMKL